MFQNSTYMNRRPCMCLPFGTTKAGAGGTEAGQVGAPEEGLSGFEAGRCVLRSAVNDSSVAWPAALFADRHRDSHAM